MFGGNSISKKVDLLVNLKMDIINKLISVKKKGVFDQHSALVPRPTRLKSKLPSLLVIPSKYANKASHTNLNYIDTINMIDCSIRMLIMCKESSTFV